MINKLGSPINNLFEPQKFEAQKESAVKSAQKTGVSKMNSTSPSQRNEAPQRAETPQRSEAKTRKKYDFQSHLDQKALNNEKQSATPPKTQKGVESAKTLDVTKSEVQDISSESAYHSDSGIKLKTQQKSILEDAMQTVSNEHKAVVSFMLSMQQEFGIKPDEIVEAMNSLSTEDLLASPKESMGSFFAKLGLTKEQIPKAENLYVKMINDMSGQKMAQEVQTQNKNLNIDVMTQAEAHKHELNQSLDRMNDDFFVRDHAKLTQTSSNQTNGTKLDPLKDFYAKPDQGQMAQAVNAENAQNLKAQAMNGQNLKQSEGGINPELLGMQMVQPQTMDSAPQVSQSQATAVDGVNQQAFNVNSEMGQNMFSSEQGSGGEGGDLSQSDVMTQNFFNNAETSETQDTSFAKEMKIAGLKGEAEDNLNMKDIYQSAQTLIRKGGGEMKIKLNPEGLGEMDLKVKIDNGQVNVQMLTTNNEAKKALEGSIADLKLSLSQKNLNVDTVSVDISDKFMDESNQQSDLSRENAREFLNNFRDQNQNFRFGAFESPGLKTYRHLSGETSNVPGDATPKRIDEGRRLYLVA